MMKYLQKLGKALMLPVAVLPICGILMGLGYALAPGVMGVPGAATSGAAYTVGFLLVKAGGALIDNMAWLFAIGAAVGLADDHDGTAGLAGLVSYLMMQQLLSPGVVSMVRTLEEGTATYIAFQKVAGNSFIGILAAVVGAACYNKFKSTQMPDWLAFFSGKRFVAIATGLISIVVSVVLLFVWPVIFDALVAIGNGIAGMDGIGAGIYAFLNRLLIPTGLHHALNNVFWFDTIGLGDLSHFWAGDTSADVGWSLGMYMSGFFPCMMFGIAGAALAMVRTAKNKKAAIGLVLSAAICAFVCGVTEPFEFGFMFLCFPLYVVYSALYGIFTIITYYSGFRAGFCFSAGDELCHDAGHGSEHSTGQERAERETRAGQTGQHKAHRTPDKAACHHRGDKGGVDHGQGVLHLAVHETGHSAVCGQLKGHGDGNGVHRGHPEQHRAEQRGGKAQCQAPGAAQHKACQQHREVHGAEHVADLRHMAGDHGQHKGQCQKQCGQHQITGRGTGLGIHQ